MAVPAIDRSCPRCGCPESEVVRRGRWRGAAYEVRICDHCVHQFRTSGGAGDDGGEPAKAVTFPKLHCPRCKSDDVITRSTQRPVRYHSCRECGYPFKSVEG